MQQSVASRIVTIDDLLTAASATSGKESATLINIARSTLKQLRMDAEALMLLENLAQSRMKPRA